MAGIGLARGLSAGIDLARSRREAQQQELLNQQLKDQMKFKELQEKRAQVMHQLELENKAADITKTLAEIQGEQADTSLTKQKTDTERSQTSQSRRETAEQRGQSLSKEGITPFGSLEEAAQSRAEALALTLGIDPKTKDQVIENVLKPGVISGYFADQQKAKQLSQENQKLMAQARGEQLRNRLQRLDIATGTANLAKQRPELTGFLNDLRTSEGVPALEGPPSQGVMTSDDLSQSMSEVRTARQKPQSQGGQGGQQTDQVEQRQIREEMRKIQDQITRIEGLPMTQEVVDNTFPFPNTTQESEPVIDVEIGGVVRALPRTQALEMLRKQLEQRKQALQGVTGTRRQNRSGGGGQGGGNSNDPLGIR